MFIKKNQPKAVLIRDPVEINLPLLIAVYWEYHKALLVVTLASSTNIPERTRSWSFCSLTSCLQPQLRRHYVKQTTWTIGYSLSGHMQNTTITTLFGWYDIAFFFTGSVHDSPYFSWIAPPKCAIVCCSVVGAVYAGGHSFLISNSWTSFWSVCDPPLCCLWALCGTQIQIKHFW